jgi:ABC-type glycerol-3-phosphate transport system substrate-binding protein
VLVAALVLLPRGLEAQVPCGEGAGCKSSLVTPVRIGAADARVKLTLWAQQEYSHLAARGDVAEIFTDLFEQWARAHPDVQIEVSVMPALELQKAKLMLSAAAGRLPDMASVDSFWMPLFLEGGYTQPLDPYWPAEERADFLPFTIDTLSDAAGHVYGLWHGTDCRVLYYRRDLVPTPPRTWDELLAVASRISRERGIAGYLYNAGRWEAAVFDHLPMFWAQGGELVDAAGEPLFGLPPHRDRLVRVMRFLRATIETGASPRAVLANNDYQQMSSAAAAGDVAMFLGGSWQLRELERASPRLLLKAMDSPANVRALSPQKLGERSLPAISLKDGGTDFTILFDPGTHLPAAIRTRDDDNISGDSDYDLVLDGWTAAGAARFSTWASRISKAFCRSTPKAAPGAAGASRWRSRKARGSSSRSRAKPRAARIPCWS